MQALQERYKQEIIPALKEKLGITNVNALPRLTKISCNVGVGQDGIGDKKVMEDVQRDLALITGQKVVVTKAKRPVSNFKIRQGFPIGCKVTLRNQLMFNFVDKLINVVMPRIRDFRGISAHSFDRAGNFGLGLKEHVVFPEIDIENVNYVFGMDINFVIRNGSREKSLELLKLFGVPFKDDDEDKAK